MKFYLTCTCLSHGTPVDLIQIIHVHKVQDVDRLPHADAGLVNEFDGSGYGFRSSTIGMEPKDKETLSGQLHKQQMVKHEDCD